MFNSLEADDGMVRRIKRMHGITLKYQIIALLKNLIPDIGPSRSFGRAIVSTLALIPWFLVGTYALGCILLYFKGTHEMFVHWVNIPSRALWYILSQISL